MNTFYPEIWLVKRRKFNPAQWLQPLPVQTIVAPAKNESISLSDEVETVLSRIEDAGIDLTCEYKDWITLGFAIASDLGETGRSIFHRLSRFHPGYDIAACNLQFDKCLKREKRPGMIKALFAAAHQAGINVKI